MSEFVSFHLRDKKEFKTQIIQWANKFPIFSYLDSNNLNGQYGKYDFIIGIDSIQNYEALESIPKNKYHFGHIGYNYNRENKSNKRTSYIPFQSCFFFEPRYVIYSKDNRVFINRSSLEAIHILDQIDNESVKTNESSKAEFRVGIDRGIYLTTVESILEDIRNGRYYELNYCIDFKAENIAFDPIYTFIAINASALSPMSALVKYNEKWVLSFSPERLACLRGNKLISQPMKGTAKRNLKDLKKDSQRKVELKNSKKERAENIMIADLVRHDLTPYAKMGSIKVEELCKIYSFPFVHQMISTISTEIKNSEYSKQALRELLPAGSMTGAPKLEAIKAIDQYEDFNRGLYAGNIGYFEPNGDFDFNVVIRSLFYDEKKKTACLNTGGAITLLSEPKKEYEECLLKVEGILKFFK